mmetsp:Transcript_13340/g.31022  ORF Transcript_13340/g.31022 Transcript_13340/m.31022 type:complete len:200 (+) Transcript_13340:944-1543(+)
MTEDLVVEEVVSQPAALLEQKSNHHCGTKVHENGIRVGYHSDTNRPHGHVGKAFVEVEHFVRIEHPHHHEFGSKITVALLESHLACVFSGNTLCDQVANVELLHHCLRTRSMEGGKDISHIVTRVGEDDRTTRMFKPIGDIVNLVVVNNPSIVRIPVLLHFFPCVFLHCFGHLAATLGRLGCHCVVSALAHCCSGTIHK